MVKQAAARNSRKKKLARTAGGKSSASKPPAAKPDVLRFVIGTSSLGAVLVASSAKGIVAILLGENPRGLVGKLEELYPKSQLTEATPADERLLAQVTAHIQDPTHALKLRLDLRGTEFQQRVWRAVARIPLGRTRTYADIAKQIGAPRAMRAVGSACAKCHFYFAVPCHRVVAGGPAARGKTRPGADRRAALLARETGTK